MSEIRVNDKRSVWTVSNARLVWHKDTREAMAAGTAKPTDILLTVKGRIVKGTTAVDGNTINLTVAHLTEAAYATRVEPNAETKVVSISRYEGKRGRNGESEGDSFEDITNFLAELTA